MKTPATILLLTCMILSACTTRSQLPSHEARTFPKVEVPSMITDSGEAMEYMSSHFWDAFLSGSGATLPGTVKGVSTADLEKAVSTYLTILGNMPKAQAQEKVASFFSSIEEAHRADTSAHLFPVFTQMVVKYLYDPNSPLRDEDLYLPFVSGLAKSPFTDEDSRPGYAFEEKMCRLAPYGTVAPDFAFTRPDGTRGSLHSIKADNILLFFSNPGCGSCQFIIQALTKQAFIEPFINMGKLAVLNMYIDSELDKWREYLPSYPDSWICAYDHNMTIREDTQYYIRAIPSLYVLDSDKRIVMKDAPVEKVIQYLSNQ